MYCGKKISVVMPAYNEEQSITETVCAFKRLPEVDEVVVVNNNSQDRTGNLAREAGAIVISETRQGYGYASKTALLSATGELVFIVEPDGTFTAKDIYKFLPYVDEFDAVIGTRTSRSCIWKGANMGYFLRYGNAAVAKLLEYVHNGPCLTDVGCTFKMIHRDVLRQIAPYLTIGKSHFSPEFMIVLIRTGMKLVEIPVNYGLRVGKSKITGKFSKAFRLGLKMIAVIIAYRFHRFPRLKSTIDNLPLGSI